MGRSFGARWDDDSTTADQFSKIFKFWKPD